MDLYFIGTYMLHPYLLRFFNGVVLSLIVQVTWVTDRSTLEELSPVQGTSVGTFWGPKDNLDKSRAP